MIKVCSICGVRNSLPTEGSPELFKNPKCGNCGTNLFPQQDHNQEQDLKKSPPQSSNDTNLFTSIKELVWPNFSSEKDVNEFLFFSGVILSGAGAISSGLLGLISGEFNFFVLAAVFTFVGLAVKKGVYWIVPLISIFFIFSFLVRGYAILKINQSGGQAGAGILIGAVLTALSIGAIRAWFVKKAKYKAEDLSKMVEKSAIRREVSGLLRFTSRFSDKDGGRPRQVLITYIQIMILTIAAVTALYYLISPYQNCLRDTHGPEWWCVERTNW